MDEKESREPIDRFERTSEGWLYFRLHPFTIYVWDHQKFGELEPDGYEVLIHFGDSTHIDYDTIFHTEEEACSFALSKAVELTRELLKKLEEM